MLAYLEDNAFFGKSRAVLLEQMGRIVEAADVHREEGRLLQAIRLLVSEKADSSATARGHSLIVHALWKAMPFGNLKNCDATETTELFRLASSFTGPLRDSVRHIRHFDDLVDASLTAP
jgi:hypothetical protein